MRERSRGRRRVEEGDTCERCVRLKGERDALKHSCDGWEIRASGLQRRLDKIRELCDPHYPQYYKEILKVLDEGVG